jgi:hypothetical protein
MAHNHFKPTPYYTYDIVALRSAITLLQGISIKGEYDKYNKELV